MGDWVMRKLIKRGLIGLGVFVLLLSGLFSFFYWRISHPAYNRLPLPEELISLESPEGKALLDQSDAKADAEALIQHFQRQQKASWCGVASAVIVLNAIDAKALDSQDDFFNECTAQTRTWSQITFGGMPIEALAGLLQCHGVKASHQFAESTSLERFRETALENMRNPRDFLIVNYSRGAVGQQETGHISPVAAYHAGSDRFLILDVADYKYPPVWVKAEKLFAAMATADSSSGHSRGYVVVSLSHTPRQTHLTPK